MSSKRARMAVLLAAVGAANDTDSLDRAMAWWQLYAVQAWMNHVFCSQGDMAVCTESAVCRLSGRAMAKIADGKPVFVGKPERSMWLRSPNGPDLVVRLEVYGPASRALILEDHLSASRMDPYHNVPVNAILVGDADTSTQYDGLSWNARSCRHCWDACDGNNRCGGCDQVRYCSPECQRADWERHKAACHGGQAVAPTSGEGYAPVPHITLPKECVQNVPADAVIGALMIEGGVITVVVAQ
jgi:hypothetical protein